MRREIVVGVVVAITISLIYWVLGLIGSIPDAVSIPRGAVVAFAAEDCPNLGWDEYIPAYGRFVRGIDKGSTKTDPDGKRTPSTPQEDSFKAHKHEYTLVVHNYTSGPASGSLNEKGGPNPENISSTGVTGDIETRPKNVALLYCIKK